MNTIKVELFLNDTWTDQEALIQSIEIHEILHNKLKNADNTASVTFAPDETLYNQLRVLFNAREEVKARIKRNDTVVFTGYIRKTLSFEKRQLLEPLKIELTSPSYILKRKVNQTLLYYQKTVSYIVYDLLSKAGVSDIESFSNSTTIPILKVAEDKETYFSVLEDLLFEYGYVFDFDSNGRFVVRNLTPTIPETPFEFNGGNLREKVEQKKSEEEYEKVIVQWKDILPLSNTIMFSDTSNAKNGFKCYIEVDPGKYLGEKDDGTGKEWYPDLVHEKGTVVYFTNAALDIVKDAGISVEKFQVENDKILISIKNISTLYMQVIKKFDITAQTMLVEANGDNKTVIINVVGTEKINEYKAKYIHTKSSADNLANLLINYYKYSDFTYSFTSQIEKPIGEIVLVSDQGTGSNTVRITARRYNPLINSFKYEAEAIDEYVPAEASTSSTGTGSGSNDYVNSIGTIIEQNDINIIDIKLYQEKTTQPAVPSGDVTYTISTGQLSGIDNGWGASIPNTSRKPVWITNYTTAVPLIQDEVIIGTGSWSTPVKMFMGTPLYLGISSTVPDADSFASERIEGDWCLCTADGKFYKWTGSTWSDTGITTANKMAALKDLLEIADASDTIAFAETLVAVDAFIENLMAKHLQLQTGGSIFSGGFDGIGNNPTEEPGIYIGSDGEVSCSSINILGGIFKNSNIEIDTYWKDKVQICSTANSGYPDYIIRSNAEMRIAYQNGSNGVYEKVWNGSAWGSETAIAGANCLSPAYTETADGELKIYYRNSSGYIACRTWNGSSWGSEELPFGNLMVYGFSAFRRLNNEVRIAYYDTSGNLKERINDGGGFGSEQVITNSATNGYCPRYFEDYKGNFRISYRTASQYLAEKLWNGSTWGSETIVNNSAILGHAYGYTRAGTLRLYYAESGDATSIKQREYTPTGWGSEEVAYSDSGYSFSQMASIRQADGKIRLAYVDSTTRLYEATYLSNAQLGAGIIEEGENSNGHYVKYSNGMMICWGSKNINVALSTANYAVGTYGWSFYYLPFASGAVVNFPASFLSSSSYRFFMQDSGGTLAIPYHQANTASQVKVGYMVASGSQATFDWFAIGTWF